MSDEPRPSTEHHRLIEWEAEHEDIGFGPYEGE